MRQYHSTERLYLDATRTRVVKHGDPDAAYLLVCAGGVLDYEKARRYGLVEDAPVSPATAAESKEAPPAEDARAPEPVTKPARTRRTKQ